MSQPATFTEELAARISLDCTVRIFFYGQVTQEGIEKLMALLDLIKDT
jgi:hypothetical protein